MTRGEPEPRDFFDLDLLRRANADFTSAAFIELVNEKLAELDAAPLREQKLRFGLTEDQIDLLAGDAMERLTSVLRADAPTFDVRVAIAEFDKMWGKGS